MPTNTPSATKVAAPTPEETASSKTFTNWNAFNTVFLRPVTIYCQHYGKGHDPSCHSKLLPKAEAFISHSNPDHSNGKFLLAVRKGDGKAAPLWNEIQDAGLEAQDFRCAVCNAILRFHPTAILSHMKPHAGETKQSYAELQRNNSGATGFFRLTLGKNQPEQALEDIDEFQD